MAPFDGQGYGKSCYWEYYARQVAFDNKEYCLCWDNSGPNIRISPNYNHLKTDPKSHEIKITIECANKQLGCPLSFKETEKELEVMFKNFYKA